jgi:hypothetical protein
VQQRDSESRDRPSNREFEHSGSINGRTLSGVTRRSDAHIERRRRPPVTPDRVVWTKPLAFAADAGHSLCVSNHGRRQAELIDRADQGAGGHREDEIKRSVRPQVTRITDRSRWRDTPPALWWAYRMSPAGSGGRSTTCHRRALRAGFRARAGAPSTVR